MAAASPTRARSRSTGSSPATRACARSSAAAPTSPARSSRTACTWRSRASSRAATTVPVRGLRGREPGRPHPHGSTARSRARAAADGRLLVRQLPGRLVRGLRPAGGGGARPGAAPRRLHLRVRPGLLECRRTGAHDARRRFPGAADHARRLPQPACAVQDRPGPAGRTRRSAVGGPDRRPRRGENYAGAIDGDAGTDPAAFLLQRAAAYRAFYEHMPLRRRAIPLALLGSTGGSGSATCSICTCSTRASTGPISRSTLDGGRPEGGTARLPPGPASRRQPGRDDARRRAGALADGRPARVADAVERLGNQVMMAEFNFGRLRDAVQRRAAVVQRRLVGRLRSRAKPDPGEPLPIPT